MNRCSRSWSAVGVACIVLTTAASASVSAQEQASDVLTVHGLSQPQGPVTPSYLGCISRCICSICADG